MDMKHERKTNTAYVKTLDLELSGNQINLSERTRSRELLNQRKKLARSLRPCTLRRPMSATPYRDLNRSKRLPPWSRPQSAGSASLRRNKLAAKFSDPGLLDPDYCPEFGATYTLSSSQMLHSLMGSCSINEGLDSDTTPTPSPQPSLGDTIRAAAQLEPGLTSKPPLPPSSTPQPRAEPTTTPTPTNDPEMDPDDIIALKFQRWFPDAILESELIQRTTLTVTPFEKQKDDADQSDAGTSIIDGPLSDRDFGEKMTNNISTFVKKSRILKNANERPEKGKTKNNPKRNKSCRNNESPQIVINEPDLYGCDLVTEEFACDRNAQSLTPDYAKTLRKSSTSTKAKSYKRLSLTDLNDVPSGSLCNSRSLSAQVYSDSEMFKDDLPNANETSKSIKFQEGISDSELYKENEEIERKPTRNDEFRNELTIATSSLNNETYLNNHLKESEIYSQNLLASRNDTFKSDKHTPSFNGTYLQVRENDYHSKQLEPHLNNSSRNSSRNNIASPSNFELSSSQYRFTSTPVNTENKEYTSESHKEESKSNNYVNEEFESKLLDEASNAKSFEHFNNFSPPIRLLPEEDEIYHDHFNAQRVYVEDELAKTYDKQEIQKTNNQKGSASKDNNETKTKQKHAHFSNPTELNRCPSETKEVDYGKASHHEKDLESWGRSYSPSDSPTPERQRRDSDSSLRSYLEKKRVESLNKESGRRSSKSKEVSRSASISQCQNSKPNPSILKQSKENCTVGVNTKRKMKRSMSYDAATMREMSEKDSGVSSYEDIVTMIKVLEKEDLESPVMQYKSNTPNPPLQEEEALQPPAANFITLEQSSSAKAIMNFLDQVDKGTVPVIDTDRSHKSTAEENSSARLEPPGSSRLGSLLNADTSDLAQQVMTLTLQLEEKTAVCRALEERHKQSVELLKQQKTERDETDRRHQKFIDQLLKEKRQLAVQYETAMREMEGKHENAIKVIEERHKVEMKKAQERFNAAEKIRRDKWIDTKTKKIKELTVKGLEPELERMAVAHQEELAELRRVHQRQLTEMEGAWVRRTAALRENEALERQAAIQHEREASRHRLEQEMNQVEKSYQEQRRRLLDEVRQEKELLQRQSERIIAEKHAEIAKLVDEAKLRHTEKLAEHDQLHKEEIERLKENLESEKQAWISRQKGGLEEKEAVLREELKRERDRQIELVIRRLDSEAAAKELAIENKIKRLKESYDSEVNDLDATLKELRAKLKETRAELQKSEDLNAALTSQLSQAQNEVTPVKQAMEKLIKEYTEKMQQTEQKVAGLQKELSENKQNFQEQVNKIHRDKEKQLHQVYTRVKEAINKKEEALILVTKQRDTALEQCDRLEKLLEAQRTHSLKL